MFLSNSFDQVEIGDRLACIRNLGFVSIKVDERETNKYKYILINELSDDNPRFQDYVEIFVI